MTTLFYQRSAAAAAVLAAMAAAGPVASSSWQSSSQDAGIFAFLNNRTRQAVAASMQTAAQRARSLPTENKDDSFESETGGEENWGEESKESESEFRRRQTSSSAGIDGPTSAPEGDGKRNLDGDGDVVVPSSEESCAVPRCMDSTCGVKVTKDTVDKCAYARSCTGNDYGVAFTECDQKDKPPSMRLYYFWKPPALCRGGVELPKPLEKVPCSLPCAGKAGQYFDQGSKTCKACPAGQKSLGGGVTFNRFKHWPSQFGAKCQRTETDDTGTTITSAQRCDPQVLKDKPERGWSVNGTSLHSGRGNVDESLWRLQSNFHFVTAGTVQFTFRVEAEPGYDGMFFTIDNEEPPEWTKFVAGLQNKGALTINGQKRHFVSYTSQFTRSPRFAVKPGFHKLAWVYRKDYSNSWGKDRADIKVIDVFGTTPVDTKCTPCPQGTFSESGKGNCTKCPADTFSNKEGTANKCTPCPTDKYSMPGSTECKPRPTCTKDDYFGTKTPCIGRKQSITYAWLAPKICHQGVALPSNGVNVQCKPRPCPPGTFRTSDDADESKCQGCPTGQYLAAASRECKDAPVGTMAIKRKYDTSFDVSPKHWLTTCKGPCGSSGWRLRGDFIDSGMGHGAGAESILEIKRRVYLPANGIVFNVSLDLDCDTTDLRVYVNDEEVKYLCARGFKKQQVTLPVKSYYYSSTIPAGELKLVFIVKKYYLSQDELAKKVTNTARISSVQIIGDEDGYAGSFAVCPKGYASPGKAASCTPCPPGSFAPTEASSQCFPCPRNTFSALPRTTKCTPCGHGTFSRKGSTKCTADCKFWPEKMAQQDAEMQSQENLEDTLAKFPRKYANGLRALIGNLSSRIATGQLHAIVYDLSPMQDSESMLGPMKMNSTTSNQFDSSLSYFVDFCPRDNDATVDCPSNKGKPMRTHSCRTTADGYAYDMGKVIGYYSLPGDKTYRKGVSVVYNNGDTCDGTKRFKTNITLLCDMSVTGRGSPHKVFMKDSCTVVYEWRTMYGCPICSDRDYVASSSECEGGKQMVTYAWKDALDCHDGVSLPMTTTRDCVKSANVPVVVIIVVIIVLSGLVPMFIVLFNKYRKYRDLYAQYKRVDSQMFEMADGSMADAGAMSDDEFDD